MKPPAKTKPRSTVRWFTAVVVTVQGSLPETINPCVVVPAEVVATLRQVSGKNQSIPVKATLQGKPSKANLVRYRGAWRLYLNGVMRKAAGVEVGDKVSVTLAYDEVARRVPMPAAFAKALAGDARAQAAFAALAPSRRKELLRYLGSLKREESLQRNILRMLRYLVGKRVDASPTGLYKTAKTKRR